MQVLLNAVLLFLLSRIGSEIFYFVATTCFVEGLCILWVAPGCLVACIYQGFFSVFRALKGDQFRAFETLRLLIAQKLLASKGLAKAVHIKSIN